MPSHGMVIYTQLLLCIDNADASLVPGQIEDGILLLLSLDYDLRNWENSGHSNSIFRLAEESYKNYDGGQRQRIMQKIF
jgi:hypothetical protein